MADHKLSLLKYGYNLTSRFFKLHVDFLNNYILYINMIISKHIWVL